MIEGMTMEILELYYDRVPNSSLSREELRAEIAWLTENDWSTEQIFFSINYLTKYYPKELENGLMEALLFNEKEVRKYYGLAKVKQSVKQAEEGDPEYDSTNKVQRADKPQWFRKSIDFNLFK